MRDKTTFSSGQLLSCVRLFVTPWTATHQASLSIINSWRLLKLMSIASVIPSNNLILGRPLFLPPSIFPSIRVFFNELVLCILQICVLQTFIKKQKSNRECKDYNVFSLLLNRIYKNLREMKSKMKVLASFLANTPLTRFLSTLFLL